MAGLYLHIPYCRQKCRYCDFVSSACGAIPDAYLRALELEAEARALQNDWGMFDTVFLGGGTPSLLTPDQLLAILNCLRTRLSIAPDAEITMECNPGTVTLASLTSYREAGVNRISIGVQSMNNSLLRYIGRIHDAQQAAQALCFAQEAGFSNINADVMYGLPGQRELDYLSTLQEVIKYGPTHISAYSLIVEEGTPLHGDAELLRMLPDEDETFIMQQIGAALMFTHGYMRYEISNYAKPGSCCRHNLNYWENGMYLGLGAAAHSAWRLPDATNKSTWTRWENARDVEAYITNPTAMPEKNLIAPTEEAFESVMLGLRMVEGLDLSAFYARFGYSFEEKYPRAITALKAKGWLVVENGRARLTEEGLDMQNAALLEFMEE